MDPEVVNVSNVSIEWARYVAERDGDRERVHGRTQCVDQVGQVALATAHHL